ncbi:hypothetical protein AYI69_g10884, partial [Smittium culicis]
MAQTVK